MAYIHVHLSREEGLARRVQQHESLEQIQSAENEQVVRAIGTSSHESIEGADKAHGDVPLKSLLQLEELVEGRIAGDLGDQLRRRRFLLEIQSRVLDHGGCTAISALRSRQANVGQQTLDLAQTLSDLGAVVGREVVERKR